LVQVVQHIKRVDQIYITRIFGLNLDISLANIISKIKISFVKYKIINNYNLKISVCNFFFFLFPNFQVQIYILRDDQF
jgi:hypothetical protein